MIEETRRDKMIRKLSVLMIIMLFTLSIYVPMVQAADGSINVSLPGFKVTLNGTVIENETNQYPLIVYKDITYFPMTYYDCRLLGLESVWDSTTGLKIAKTGVN